MDLIIKFTFVLRIKLRFVPGPFLGRPPPINVNVNVTDLSTR